MDYLDLTISDIHKALLQNKVTPLELVKEAIKRAKSDTNNCFEYISEKEAFEQVSKLNNKDKNNPLWGIPFVIKDNFSTKGIPTTGSSNLLNDYIPCFDSEAYSRLINAGGILIGKTTLDELAMGGLGSSGHKGKTFNPYDPTHQRIIGGSSCGSASATCAAIVPLGIGSDTGDSVRKPASYSGLVGFKPTWGRISRYGLFPFAVSLDHVAYFTRSVEDAAIVLEILAGKDDKDLTSADIPVKDYKNALNPCISSLKIAVIDEIINSISDKQIIAKFNNSLDYLKTQGATINHVSIDLRLLRALQPSYFIISSSEGTSSNANLDGIKYGLKEDGKDYEEIMIKTRTKGFSEPLKRRFIIGAYSLLKENQKDIFVRAQKARRLIVQVVDRILSENDCIYLPASPSVAPRFDQKIDALSDDFLIANNHLVIGNFGGYPSLTLPLGKIDNLPFGVNVTGRRFDEQTVFNISLAIEQYTGLKNLSIKGK